MFDIFVAYNFIFGICIGVVLATIVCVLATYFDHARMQKIAKQRAYDSMDLLFSNSEWDRRVALEIALL